MLKQAPYRAPIAVLRYYNAKGNIEDEFEVYTKASLFAVIKQAYHQQGNVVRIDIALSR